MVPFCMIAVFSKVSGFVGEPNGPSLSAEAAIVMDVTTGRVLWGKNIQRSMYPASTTKLLTAIILLDETSPTDVIQAPADIKEIKGSSLHLEPKEQISAKDALYALLIRSGNDVAHSIAVHLSGSDEKFAEKMNAYSQKFGMKNSLWVTPHGLNNPWHKTTAYDMALLGREAAKHPAILEVTCSEKHTVTRDINQKDTLLINKNKLLKLDQSNRGLKTGYTDPAGHCFVGLNDSDFGQVVTVVLNSNDWWGDQLKLVNWTKSRFGIVNTIAEGKMIEVPVPNAKDGQVLKAKVAKPITALVSNHDLNNLQINLEETNHEAPIQEGADLGKAEVIVGDQKFEVELVAMNSVEAKFSLEEFKNNPLAIGFVIIASAGYWLRKRTYKRLQS